jgi:formamidopyrimidine-DNA glycosylase
MPELPEVETVVQYLRPQLVGRKLNGITLGRHRLRSPWKPAWDTEILGKTIEAVERRGKWILLQLSREGEAPAEPQTTRNDSSHLVVHLGMTGRLLVTPAKDPQALHTHFVFPLDQGRDELRYHDPRRFGSVTWAKTHDTHRFPQEAELGPEPFSLKPNDFHAALSNSSRCLKAILLDQTIVAGVGNIYADESLHRAKLLPTRSGRSLSTAESKKLCQAIVAVLTKAIERKGSTISSFYFGDGESGNFQNEFNAYDRADEPCKRCKTPMVGIRLAGRTTTYCPVCQV